MSLTATDLFCGAGGSSLGATQAGAELRLGLNHWRRAIETHGANFPEADHDCADVSALTTAQIRRYPDTDLLLASPECTNHSLAKGALRRKPQASSLFDDGPAGDDEQDRSRATMWDVPRFAEQKLIKGKPYKAIVVENVPDAFKWGYNDDGGLFEAWRQAMSALGYDSQIVWLNSMFCPPTPQSRDRMYVVFWQRGARRPNLKVEPPCWCVDCGKVVRGQQVWKKPDNPWGRYGQQYLFACPECHAIALPAVAPAASAIDWSLPAERIGDRKKPLADNTLARIKRGLERLSTEPFAIRLLQGGTPRPLTLPLVTLTQRHDVGVVLPVAGNTFERTPGNRARLAQLVPMDTMHGTLDRALVVPPMGGADLRDADLYASPTQTTTTRAGLVTLQRHATVEDVDTTPVGTMRGGGFHHGLICRNNNNPGGDSGSMVTSDLSPVHTLATRGAQSVLIPYNRTGQPAYAEEAPSPTLSTRDRMAVLVPEVLREESESPVVEWSEKDIDQCRFRMFDLGEIARVMQLHEHVDGDEYVVTGNKRERMAQYGNAVTPPAMQFLVSRLTEALQ